MPKLRRAAMVRSAKSIAVRVACKIGGRKSKIGVASLSADALKKEAGHTSRLRDKNKIMAEMNKRGLVLEIETTEPI